MTNGEDDVQLETSTIRNFVILTPSSEYFWSPEIGIKCPVRRSIHSWQL